MLIGHCRFEAAKLLELEDVPTISVEGLSDKEVRALRIADNKLNESAWDIAVVIDDLKGLDKDLMDLTGFDEHIIIQAGGFVPNYFPEQNFEGMTKEEMEAKEKQLMAGLLKKYSGLKTVCPHCGEEFEINQSE